MILWSTRNAKELECNNLKVKLRKSEDKSMMYGAVASWYFDGEKMHHNFILEPCNIRLSENELFSESKTKTYFCINKNGGIVKIGDNFEFVAEAENKHEFTSPAHQKNTFIRNKGYDMIKLNHLKLSGKVDGQPIKGSAYFQRVFVNSPMSSWYWGLAHFENGSVMTYFKPYLFGKSFRKDISFFDGKEMHKFDEIKLKRRNDQLPMFSVSGENEEEKISFVVSAYSHSFWILRNNVMKFIPNQIFYNEYPAVISDFTLENKKTGEKITLKELGKSVCNAEHATGIMF
jgi:hypothetical protein